MSSWFVVSVLSTLIYNKVKYPPITPSSESITLYDDIPVTRDRLLNFSAGAGYWTYYIGIAKFIQENYDLDTTDLIGTSAGSLVCTALAYKIPIPLIFNYALVHLERCRENALGVIGYWNIGYKQAITECYAELNITSTQYNMYSGVSRLTRYGFKKQYMDGGATIDTLVTSLVASCWISFVTAPLFQPLIYVKDAYYGDGFWTGRDKSKHKKHLVIYPNRFRRLPLYTYWLWMGRDYNISMFSLGYEDAKKHRQLFDEFFA
jgi:hypothetical protein